MLFSILLTVTMTTSAIGAQTEVMSITQTSLAADRCSSDQILLESECVALPTLLKKRTPSYPTLALRALLQTTVEFTATVRPDGTIGDIRVTKPSGAPKLGFEKAVTTAFEKWHYQPVLLHGKPVSIPFVLKVEFKIESR
jgi:TonB family protein